jgi:hypothetical protein
MRSFLVDLSNETASAEPNAASSSGPERFPNSPEGKPSLPLRRSELQAEKYSLNPQMDHAPCCKLAPESV